MGKIVEYIGIVRETMGALNEKGELDGRICVVSDMEKLKFLYFRCYKTDYLKSLNFHKKQVKVSVKYYKDNKARVKKIKSINKLGV